MDGLNEHEQLLLTSAGLKFSQLLGLFTCNQSSAFHALCSLITKGVGASPSKSRKRLSFLELFTALFKNSCAINRTIPDKKMLENPEEVDMSFLQMFEAIKGNIYIPGYKKEARKITINT